jgi:gluconate kinase
MTVYFLYGKTGSGKSYIGSLLEQHHIIHIDGDNYITQTMKDCLAKRVQMTPTMIDEFVEALIDVINQKKKENPEQSFVISQALYLDKHRLKLLKAIPDLQFVLMDVKPVLRAGRISSRFQNNESKVSLSYAIGMDKFFEDPTHDIIRFENNQDSDEALLEQIQEKMPALFSEEVKEALGFNHPLSFA